jgi:gamma-glutamyl-gamma-aminobutyrate hydrolase PuuD
MELNSGAARVVPFLLSVQFHPERLTERYGKHRAIFERFIQVCAQPN